MRGHGLQRRAGLDANPSPPLTPVASLSLESLLCLKSLEMAPPTWLRTMVLTDHVMCPASSLALSLDRCYLPLRLSQLDHELHTLQAPWACYSPLRPQQPSTALVPLLRGVLSSYPVFFVVVVPLSSSHCLMYYISVYLFIFCHRALECRLSEKMDFFFFSMVLFTTVSSMSR